MLLLNKYSICLLLFFNNLVGVNIPEFVNNSFDYCKQYMIKNFEKDKLPIMPEKEEAIADIKNALLVTLMVDRYNHFRKTSFEREFERKLNLACAAEKLLDMTPCGMSEKERRIHNHAIENQQNIKKLYLKQRIFLTTHMVLWGLYVHEPVFYFSKFKNSQTFFEYGKYGYLMSSLVLNYILSIPCKNIFFIQGAISNPLFVTPGILYAGFNRFYHAYKAYQSDERMKCAGHAMIGTSLFIVLSLGLKQIFFKN